MNSFDEIQRALGPMPLRSGGNLKLGEGVGQFIHLGALTLVGTLGCEADGEFLDGSSEFEELELGFDADGGDEHFAAGVDLHHPFPGKALQRLPDRCPTESCRLHKPRLGQHHAWRSCLAPAPGR